MPLQTLQPPATNEKVDDGMLTAFLAYCPVDNMMNEKLIWVLMINYK